MYIFSIEIYDLADHSKSGVLISDDLAKLIAKAMRVYRQSYRFSQEGDTMRNAYDQVISLLD